MKINSRILMDMPSIPPLSRKEEKKLVRRWQKKRDSKALERLIKAHINLIKKYAFKYQGYQVDDVASEAVAGFIHAVGKFDTNNGSTLYTYSLFWIRNYIQKYRIFCASGGKTGHLITSGAIAIAGKHKNAVKRAQYGERPEYKDIQWTDVRLDKPVFPDDSATVGELFTTDDPSPEDTIIGGDRLHKAKKLINRVIRGLDDKERYVIRRRFLDTPTGTLKTIGEEMSLTRERVRQIEIKAKKKLKLRLYNFPELTKDVLSSYHMQSI